MLMKIFQVFIGIIVAIWLFSQFKEWFGNTFPKITEYFHMALGFIGLWVLATVFFGLGGFLFMLLLYGVFFVNETYYGVINFFRSKNKK